MSNPELSHRDITEALRRRIEEIRSTAPRREQDALIDEAHAIADKLHNKGVSQTWCGARRPWSSIESKLKGGV